MVNSAAEKGSPLRSQGFAAAEQGSGRKLFYGLFVFPLLIAVGMATLLCTVVLLTREAETPESLITAIKTGSPSKRWQKAFELSNELNQGRGMIRESGVMKEIIHIMNDAGEYDARTRSYMAMALARFDEPEAVAALKEALKREPEPDVQIHLIWALGIRQAGEALDQILPFLKSEKEDLRKTAAYVAGALGDTKAVDSLRPLLEDSARDVRWNAALSLARLGSDAGYGELLKMLDRESLATYHRLSDAKIEEIMVNAVKGIALLEKAEAMPELARISANDKSLKVRQAAMDALEYQKGNKREEEG